MLWTLSIIILMAGCGDVSAPAAPAKPPSGAEPTDSSTAEPAVVDLPCSEATVTNKHVYFYAETEAPEWEFQALRCTETDSPTMPPLCEETVEYLIEGGVLRVSCGEWDVEGEFAGFVVDFVRIEPTSLQR